MSERTAEEYGLGICKLLDVSPGDKYSEKTGDRTNLEQWESEAEYHLIPLGISLEELQAATWAVSVLNISVSKEVWGTRKCFMLMAAMEALMAAAKQKSRN